MEGCPMVLDVHFRAPRHRAYEGGGLRLQWLGLITHPWQFFSPCTYYRTRRRRDALRIYGDLGCSRDGPDLPIPFEL
jgi:hypothetical protein